MTIARSLTYPLFLLVAAAGVGCQPQEGELEQHAKACESQCAQAHDACAAEPDFADPWTLSCEVACNLDFNDEAEPFLGCMDAAATCDAKNECVSGFPASSDTGTLTDSDPTDATDPTNPSGPAETTSPSSTTVDPSTTTDDPDTGEEDSSTGGVEAPPCCGGSCSDAEIADCTCYYMPSCCEGEWDELCTNTAVANECIETGCPALADTTIWDCSCNTIEVYCPDDPFVGQIYVFPDVCGLGEADALATAAARCEAAAGECEVTPGSCDCECTQTNNGCGPV